MSARPIVHIGYHKTASTWLQEAVFPFARNAGLVPREVAIRALLEPNALTFDPTRARRQLEEAVPGRMIVSLEGLSGYLHNGGMHGALSRDIASRIHATLPDADILALIRRQPSVLAASYAQYIRYGGTWSAQRYLFPSEYPGAMHTRRDKIPRFDLDHFAYLPLLRLYRGLFGRDRVHVRLYEALRARPRAFLDELGAALDLDWGTLAAEPSARNRSLPPAALALVRRINLFTPGRVLDKTHILHVPGAFWLGRGIGRALSEILPQAGSELERLVPARRLRQIQAYYAASNRRLAAEFELPLERYGYPLREREGAGQRTGPSPDATTTVTCRDEGAPPPGAGPPTPVLTRPEKT